MGFDPRQVDKWSLWQFFAVVEGWKSANGVEDKLEPPSVAEYYEMRQRAGEGW